MSLASYALPFGLRQVVLTPYAADGTPDDDNAIKLPASRTFSFKETEDFQTLEGDDHTVASHGAGPQVEFDLEGGGISLDVWALLGGGTITESGTTPAVQRTFSKKTSDSRPYFQVEGRAVSDSGGDFHMVVYRCKADGDLEAEMTNGDFTLTKAGGHGFGDETSEKLYDFVHNETPVVIVTP